MKLREDLDAYLRRNIAHVHETAPDNIGSMMQLELISCDTEQGIVRMRGKTEPWMQNFKGVIHGGIGATMVDQAMGYVAYAIKLGQGGFTSTVTMNLNYHRPLLFGEDPEVVVRPISVTRSLIALSAEIFLPSEPEKICVSATATFFYKPPKA